MRLHDIMTTDVETIQAVESADTAAGRMFMEDIHHLVVLKGDDIVGVLSQKDLGDEHDTIFRQRKRVADLMHPRPITVSPETTLQEAADKLRGNNIGCLPVLDHGKLVGIITLTDVLEIIGIGVTRQRTQSPHKPELSRPKYQRPGHSPRH